MSNKEILSYLKRLSVLLDLYDENPFKVKSLSVAVFNLGRLQSPLYGLGLDELQRIDGVGKSIAAYIDEVNRTGNLQQILELEEKTPDEVLLMAFMKGVGPKKARVLWTELGADTLDKVLQACEANQVASLKGFGQKSQDNIKEAIQQYLSNRGKLHGADAAFIAMQYLEQLQIKFKPAHISLTGELRRKLEVVEKAEILIATEDKPAIIAWLDKLESLIKDEQGSGPFQWQGRDRQTELLLVFMFCAPNRFATTLMQTTGSAAHLLLQGKLKPLRNVLRENHDTEESIYAAAGLPYFIPELREGIYEKIFTDNVMPEFIQVSDLKGNIHNHSTWSDGIHSVEQMAQRCLEMGYQYFGIADHSQTAVYANGMDVARVRQQHKEIHNLNQALKPFIIFKGIESDILDDGSLDYPDDVLMEFDFVVASIHAQLNMSIDKATRRLVRAIENPFTTILGHPTGRLLLERQGYPIDYKIVIDACAANGVVIEINANPWRLDLDWRWLRYAVDKGVMLSINPDAHNMDDLAMVKHGVDMARKAGLEAKHIFNALDVKSVAAHFAKRKERAASILGMKV